MQLPLEGITVLEFSQYLSGPCAGLRLADLGARVVKIERPGVERLLPNGAAEVILPAIVSGVSGKRK